MAANVLPALASMLNSGVARVQDQAQNTVASLTLDTKHQEELQRLQLQGLAAATGMRW